MNCAASLQKLLRCVHQPKVLERDTFGVMLKRALGTASVYDALTLCVDRAFAQDGTAWSLHRSILYRFTLEQHVPRYRAAGELGISPRRFYYLQAEAVALVAAYAQTLLRTQDGAASLDDLAALLMESDPARAVPLMGSQTAALYAHVISTPHRFELPAAFQTYKAADAGLAGAFYALRSEYRGERGEALARLERVGAARLNHLGHASHLTDLAVAHVRGIMARHDGDAQALAFAAQQARIAGSQMPRGFEQWDVLLTIQSALANGDYERAAETIEAALPAAVREGAYRFALLLALHRAQVLFVRGEFDAAAHAAEMLRACAGSHADVVSASAALAVRACLASGKSTLAQWPEPYTLWDALYAQALSARADALAGAAAAAGERAQQVRSAASALGYAGIEAHALGSIALAQNDVSAALEAWSVWLRGRHALQGFDLIGDIPVRALLLHRATLNELHRLAQRDAPQWPMLAFVNGPQQIADFWSELVTAALDGSPADTIAPLVDRLLAAGSAHPAEESGAPAGTKPFTSAAALLVPFAERVHFRRALSALLQYSNGRARRWILRRRARAAVNFA